MNAMYPARVTLYEDGVYRWSYDMDMWHNTFMRNLMLKVIAVIFAFPVGFFLIMLLARVLPPVLGGHLRRVPRAMMTDMLLPLLVTLLIYAGTIGLTLLIYAISALVMHGNYHLCFEMDDSGVALVRSPGTAKTVNALGIAATAAALAAGKPGGAMRAGSIMLAANMVGTTAFRSVRRVRLYPEKDVINLSELFGMNQIYVGEWDYPFVKDFILNHVREKARGKEQAPPFEL